MTQIFDQQAALNRMGHDRELFREMIELLLEVSPSQLGNASQGLECRDARKVRLAAHTLKGLSENFDAVRAVAAASRVEDLALVGSWEDLEKAVAELYSAFTELLSAIRPLATSASKPTA